MYSTIYRGYVHVASISSPCCNLENQFHAGLCYYAYITNKKLYLDIFGQWVVNKCCFNNGHTNVLMLHFLEFTDKPILMKHALLEADLTFLSSK